MKTVNYLEKSEMLLKQIIAHANKPEAGKAEQFLNEFGILLDETAGKAAPRTILHKKLTGLIPAMIKFAMDEQALPARPGRDIHTDALLGLAEKLLPHRELLDKFARNYANRENSDLDILHSILDMINPQHQPHRTFKNEICPIKGERIRNCPSAPVIPVLILS